MAKLSFNVARYQVGRKFSFRGGELRGVWVYDTKPMDSRAAASRVKGALHIRAMTASDLAFADSLRALAGWNQTVGDWRRYLSMRPTGCFLAEWDGAAAGTAATLVYGADLAWIGMVLVQPELRRRGIGRGLLMRCIEHLRASGARCIKLDATPEGRPAYEGLGFKAEWTLRRWEAELSAPGQERTGARVRDWEPADAERFDEQDARAFGVSRRDLIVALAGQSRCALVCDSGDGGFGMLRQGAMAAYLGPVSAGAAEAGIALIEALLDRAGAGRVFWDIPDLNAPAVEWAGRHGFSTQRSLTRMWLGENCRPGNPLEQFALAGPESG